MGRVQQDPAMGRALQPEDPLVTGLVRVRRRDRVGRQLGPGLGLHLLARAPRPPDPQLADLQRADLQRADLQRADRRALRELDQLPRDQAAGRPRGRAMLPVLAGVALGSSYLKQTVEAARTQGPCIRAFLVGVLAGCS